MPSTEDGLFSSMANRKQRRCKHQTQILKDLGLIAQDFPKIVADNFSQEEWDAWITNLVSDPTLIH